jgi:sugar lactone lactonase YvrE
MNRRSIFLIAAIFFAVLSLSASIIFVSAQAPKEADTPAQPEVALGQPGLSFRYVKTFGVTEEPYQTDKDHLYMPFGLYVDSSNFIYVSELFGQRVLKFNASGVLQLPLGHAGLPRHQDDFLNFPKDVTVDGAGNIWVANEHMLKEFSPTGAVIQTFPDAEPWNSGTDNSHFNTPNSVAFDKDGRLYVADSGNNRIQVFQISMGMIVYSSTIGVTGESGTDNQHFNWPQRVVIDSSYRVYVMDNSNVRVQRCEYAGGWTCNTFFGETGVEGNDLAHLGNWPDGLFLRGSDLYISDGANHRVIKCNLEDSCSVVVNAPNYFHDVAVDSSENIYIADSDHHYVLKYNNAGVLVQTLGAFQTPYLVDAIRLNEPWGVAVAQDSSIYIKENSGHRLVKLNSSGVQVWAIGQAGVWGQDNAHFGIWSGGFQGNPAVDATGKVYVGDTGNERVQIYNADGTYYATIGVTEVGGSDNAHFSCPTGVAISPVNGDIYVADKCNQRIQIFNSARSYKATIGVSGEPGGDNLHFNSPSGVAVDKNGNIFIADTDNFRIQKCNLSGSISACSTFAGVTGEFGDDFSHLRPLSVAVDLSGRVYAADELNNRIQVYDTSGAYLTTIGGNGGTNSGQMSNPKGVAVDQMGNVYIADTGNHRIQVFAPGVPGWKQANINGFGNRYLQTGALEVFNGQLYASASNWDDLNLIYRSNDGKTWEQVKALGHSGIAIDMAIFNGQLYACTGWGNPPAGRILRTSNGTTWEEITSAGFGVADYLHMDTLAVFQNKIYVSVSDNTNNAGGLAIYRSDTGNIDTWAPVVTGGKGDVNNQGVYAMVEFNGYLYAGVHNMTSGTRIWRTSDGITWNQVNTDGFGSANNTETITMAIYKGQLYAGTINKVTGGQIWRTSNGTTWNPVMTDGFGDPNKSDMLGLYVFENRLYATANNDVTGTEVWATSDGDHWSQANFDGWGDSNNGFGLRGNAGANFKNNLFISVTNNANGGEIWQMLHQVYLPFTKR